MTELAKRYGGSLYDLAAEEQLTDQLLAELDVEPWIAVTRSLPICACFPPPAYPKKNAARFLTRLLPKHTRTW